MSCKFKNLLSCITCNICEEEYIGETGTQITPTYTSIANRLHVTIPALKKNTPAIDILTDVQKEITTCFHFITFKPIQSPLGLLKMTTLLNYFPENLTNTNNCISDILF